MLGVKIYFGFIKNESCIGYSYVAETIDGTLIVSRFGKSKNTNRNIVMRAILETLRSKNHNFTHVGIYSDDTLAISTTTSINNKL